MEIQKELKELREKLESLEKQISSKHEFAKGWYWAELNYFTASYLAYFDNGSKNSFGHLSAKYYTSNGKFFNEGSFTKIDRPATPSEIKDALKNVCDKLGLKPGSKVKTLNAGEIVLSEKDERGYRYDSDTDCFGLWGNGWLYEKGQFATVVKEEEIKIGGYEVKFLPERKVKVGCKTIPEADLYYISSFMREQGIKTGSFEDIKFTNEDLNKIIKQLEK